MNNKTIRPLKLQSVQVQKQQSQVNRDASSRSRSKSKSPMNCDPDTSVLELISEIDDTLKQERRPEPEDLSILKDLGIQNSSIGMRKPQQTPLYQLQPNTPVATAHGIMYQPLMMKENKDGDEQESLQIVPSVNTMMAPTSSHRISRKERNNYMELVKEGSKATLGSCVPSVMPSVKQSSGKNQAKRNSVNMESPRAKKGHVNDFDIVVKKQSSKAFNRKDAAKKTHKRHQ